ncbi:MAG TPA: DUF2207 domain-containing protein [Candidatus Saccharimonadales bacterium]|nr:DUF2207 domain-containing protein [Candidatus Saccharimonadales bacterium]
MRKCLLALLIIVGLLVPATGVRADAQDFTFTSFSGDYYLDYVEGTTIAGLRVVERLDAEFPDFDQNHGILRAIPEDYQGHPLELDIKKVAMADGTPVNYQTSHQNGNLVLKIGDPNSFVHGSQAYVIEYTMRGVTLQLPDHEEFFWDINGDQWAQLFKKVEARVHLPANIANSLQSRWACYAGQTGTNEPNKCAAVLTDQPDGGKLVTFTTTAGMQVLPHQTMTIVLGFNKGTFAEYSPSAKQIQQWLWIGLSIALLPAAALAFTTYQWWRRGRDPKSKHAIVPQYLPPKDLGVISSGIVLKEAFDPKTVTAAIVDLAVRHYIKIYETKQKGLFTSAEYQLELVKAPTDVRAEELLVIMLVFKTDTVGTKVNLDDLKLKLAEEARQIGKSSERQLTTDGYFRVLPSRATFPYYLSGSIFLIIGFFLFAVGGLEQPWALGWALAGILLIICAHAMPARTAKGVEARNYLLGVRDYIKLAEAERIKVLQSPHGDLTEKIEVGDNRQLIKVYEKLLPYAILFNLEKDWAKAMAGLYQESPDWYSGNAAFNAAWFAGSIASFNTSANTVFAPPSSSSSSGFGGGAGGGGGGGGGGGW